MLRTIIAASAVALALMASPASSQTYPSQPIRMIVTFAPGGGSDLLGRLTAELLGPRLGQPVIIENKPGAGATLGADIVAKAKPDGYTLLWAALDSVSIAPSVKASTPYRVPDDFTFVAQITGFAYIIVVNPKLPINNLKELIDYGKTNPGKLRYGSSGTGGGAHLAPALFAKEAGIEMTHVPFGGSGPATTAAMGGHVDIVFVAPQVKGHTDSGALRAVAQTGATRDPNFTNVPTLTESAFPNLAIAITWGIMAPAGTPEPILDKLRTAAAEMMKDPVTAERLRKLGFEPLYLPHDQYKAFVIKDLEQWRGVAKSANIAID
jgi:tripartite-type tricarboxylate transporter receptor subunit TctC